MPFSSSDWSEEIRQVTAAFARFDEDGFIKVAWALRVVPESDHASLVEFELRAVATEDDAWKKFSRYFRLIGPGSQFIRRVLLAQLEQDLGTPESEQNERALPGDELIPDALGQLTHSIVVAAPAAKIWPWLVQMGCRRAGFYSLDLLDNAGAPSAYEIRLDLQQLRVGDKIPSTPDGMTTSRFFDCKTTGSVAGRSVRGRQPATASVRCPSSREVLAGNMGVRPRTAQVPGGRACTRERAGHSLRANAFTRFGSVPCTT